MNKKWIFVGAMLVTTSAFAQEKESQIETVTIASKSPQLLHKTGKNITLITEKDLEKYQGQSLPDVLNQVAGIQITGNANNGPEPKSLKVRGGKSSNIIILIDGVPLKDVTGNDYNASDLRMIALDSVTSIEVMNGASSVLYGSNATVSVININTNKSASKKIEGNLGLRVGSYSTFAQEANVRGKIKAFTYQIGGNNEKSEGLSSAQGNDEFDKDGWEKQNISAKFGLDLSKVKLGVHAGWNHHLYQFDTGAFTDSNQKSEDIQKFIGGKFSYQYSTKGNLIFNLRYSATDRMVKDLVENNYQNQYEYLGNNFFAELYSTYQFTDKLNAIAGVQYEKQSMEYSALPWGGDLLEVVNDFEDTHVSYVDAFAKINYKHNNFNIDLGGRYTNHSKFNNQVVYSINPYYTKDFYQTFVKAGVSFATAFIAPTLYQNYGSMPWVLPNFDLKPETNQSYEFDFTFGKKDQSFIVKASAFLRKEKDAFVYVTNPDYTGIFQNVDENEVKGLEIGVDYQIISPIRIGANYAFVEKEKAASMLRQPKHRINSYVQYQPFASTNIMLTHQYVGKRADAYYDNIEYITKNVTVKAYHLLNINIQQNITKQLNAFLFIGNILDEKYEDVVGFTTKNRNFTLGVNYNF